MVSKLEVDTIAHSGGTTGMTIDSSGRAVMPNRPYFSGTKTNQSVSGSTNTILIPDTMQNNNGSHYSTSTGKFTAPVSAVYTFGGAFVFAENQQSYGFLQHSNSGGSNILQYYTANQTDNSAAEVTRYVFTATFYMTATDTVCLTIAQFGNTQNVSCFFTGAMIG